MEITLKRMIRLVEQQKQTLALKVAHYSKQIYDLDSKRTNLSSLQEKEISLNPINKEALIRFLNHINHKKTLLAQQIHKLDTEKDQVLLTLKESLLYEKRLYHLLEKECEKNDLEKIKNNQKALDEWVQFRKNF